MSKNRQLRGLYYRNHWYVQMNSIRIVHRKIKFVFMDFFLNMYTPLERRRYLIKEKGTIFMYAVVNHIGLSYNFDTFLG